MLDARSYSYDITGLSQKRSGYWLATLRNSHFKNSSIQHLIYERDENSHLVKKKLFVNNNNDCYSFTVKDERLCKMYKRSSYLTHEHADSKMIFHLNLVTNPTNFVIRTSDTDVLVIALWCMPSMSSDIKELFLFS